MAKFANDDFPRIRAIEGVDGKRGARSEAARRNKGNRLELHWLVKLQWLAAASDRLRVAERPRFRRAYRGHRWSGSGLPCDHGRTSCRARATRRYAANDGVRNVDFECFLGSSGTMPLHTVAPPLACKDAQTNTFDPRRPGATSSLLSCRQSQTLVGALILAVVISGVVDSGRKSGRGNIDANDPTATLVFPAWVTRRMTC